MTRQLHLTGVLVREIHAGSPAAAAGMQPTQTVEYAHRFRVDYGIRYGDLIVAGDGEPIDDLDNWFSFLEKHAVGDRVKLTVIRDLRAPQEQKLDIEITLVGPES